MLHKLWVGILYQPLYNLFILLALIMPGNDAGLAIVALTILVKVILLPLTQKTMKGQMKVNALQGELNEIKKSTSDKLEQQKKTQELYKKYGINPFSSCLLFIIQILVLIALYEVFRGIINLIPLPSLYNFVTAPANLELNFLGIADLTAKGNIIFAIIAGVTAYIQAVLMKSRQPINNSTGAQADMAKMMQKMTVYFLPIMLTFISYTFPSAVALYLITSNIFTIAQELYIKHTASKETKVVTV